MVKAHLVQCGGAANLNGFRVPVRAHRRDTAYYSLLDEEWPERRSAIARWLRDGNFDSAGHAIEKLERPKDQHGIA